MDVKSIFVNKKLAYIHEIRRKGDPFLYINSLLNLFKITLTTTYIDFFINYMNYPRIISNSKFLKKFKKTQDKILKKIPIDEIERFRNFFLNEKDKPNLDYIDEEENDKCVEESENSSESEEEKHEKTNKDDNEEDKYASQEEEENYEYPEESAKNNKSNEVDEKINFMLLINNKVIKKLVDLYINKEKTIKFNDDLVKKSLEYSNNLNKLLKENKLI
jgi:hypothetical protein